MVNTDMILTLYSFVYLQQENGGFSQWFCSADMQDVACQCDRLSSLMPADIFWRRMLQKEELTDACKMLKTKKSDHLFMCSVVCISHSSVISIRPYITLCV